MEPKKKKALIGIAAVMLVIIMALWFWRAFERKNLERQLERVEQKIAETQMEIERLARLPPEEVARRERESEIFSATKAAGDVAIEGVEILERNGRKIIRNIKEEYAMEVPLNLIIARSISSERVELHDRDHMCEGDPLCEPVMRIEAVERNGDNLSAEEWFAREEKRAGAPIYSPREKIRLGGEIAHRVAESIPRRFEGYYYYWSKGAKVYSLRISSVDETLYRSYLETFLIE